MRLRNCLGVACLLLALSVGLFLNGVSFKENTSLNGTYAPFGRVIEGMDIVDKIVNLETEKETSDDGTETNTEKPVNPPVITKMTVDTFGVDYGYPETLEPFDYTSWIMQMYQQQ